MKREGGIWAMAAAVGLATTIGISSNQAKAPADSVKMVAQKTTRSQPRTSGQTKNPIEDGPCPDIEKLLQAFFLVSEDEIVAPTSCFPLQKNNKAPSVELLKKARPMQFMIATLPDPLHTHFSLSFDRTIEALQQGAQDEYFSYNSSWLPWELEDSSYALLDDQDKADKRKDWREDQPGLLLFRRQVPDTKPDKPPDNSPFGDGLLIFIVGDEPTGGIHRRQFENALQWIQALQPTPGPAGAVQILGPSFSGSLPSLVELLQQAESPRDGKDRLSARVGQQLRIFSGNVSSNAGVGWLDEAVAAPDLQKLNVEFRSFQHSGDLDLDRYCRYVSAAGTKLSNLAIISEDETAFGAEYSSGLPDSSPCHPTDGDSGPVHLYYPRDISALRAAYQSQSIFTRSTPSSGDSAPRKLQSDLADPEGKDHDTVRSYSGDQTALSQEAELLQIVSLLRAHSSQYLLLRCSNPLDQLFLSHFFRMTYPAGRIVIVGADLLLRRETGISGLNGVMTLSTYPLLPWEQDWTKALKNSRQFHYHRAFTNDGTESTYVAERFLLHRMLFVSPSVKMSSRANDEGARKPESNFVPPNCDDQFNLPDYRVPFWMNEAENTPCRRPPTWLSVLGNGGFWPVAALDYPTQLGKENPDQIGQLGEGDAQQSRLRNSLTTIGASIGFLLRGNRGDNSPSQWPAMPPSMKFLMLGALTWAVFHLICCSRASITVKPAHRAHFARPRCANDLQKHTHWGLVLFGSMLVAFLPITLAWGCGEMWEGGDPVPNARFYRAFLTVIWLIAGAAVCANTWVEGYLILAADAKPDKLSIRQRRDRAVWFLAPLFSFLVLSAGLYWSLDYMLDRALNDANRMPTYWRAINLTTGVSPLVPLVALCMGLYGWFWYSLQGMALLGEDRPQLPSDESLQISVPRQQSESTTDQSDLVKVFGMLSKEYAAQPIEELSSPFNLSVWGVAALCFVATILVGSWIFGWPPIRNLGSKDYSVVFCCWLGLCISVVVANTWQLARIWLRLRHLLQYLDRLPLRRTMLALGGLSWGSVWKMSGNVLDTRYKMIFRQLESWTHLRAALETKDPGVIAAGSEQYKIVLGAAKPCIKAINAAAQQRLKFAEWYSLHWDDWKARDLDHLRSLQGTLAETTATILTKLLVPAWRKEKQSAESGVAAPKEGSEESKPEASKFSADTPLAIRNAEELVCLVYTGFIQNILGRIRSLVLGIACIFLSITVAVSTYPFDPRALLSGIVVFLFLTLGMTIVFVYVQMHRDATLSNLTGTKPGELGAEFWVKLVGLGVGPALGLVASVFPEFTDFLFSWVQPGLESLK